MKKIALFVEGQTEQIFAEKLIGEVVGRHGFSMATYKFLGGKRTARKPLRLTACNAGADSEYYFVIYDCGGEGKVQSDIRDRLETVPHPSAALKRIYMMGGTTYDKSREKVERTVDALDYENLYVNVRDRNGSLNELFACLDGLMPGNAR